MFEGSRMESIENEAEKQEEKSEKPMEQILSENLGKTAGIRTERGFLQGTLRQNENGFFIDIERVYRDTEQTVMRKGTAPESEKGIFEIDPNSIRRTQFTKSRYLDLEYK